MESNATYNGSGSPSNSSYIPEYDDFYKLTETVVWIVILLVGPVGMTANGTIIWILGCHVKRNPFTIYILNLSVADFALLTTIVSHSTCFLLRSFHYIYYSVLANISLSVFFLLTFSTSQFLLMVISIERCVCLFFPLWHKCHRPPYLSTVLCVTIWIVAFLISVISIVLGLSSLDVNLWYHQFLLNMVLCIPAISISTIAMWIKVCFMSPHHKRGKLLTAILLSLLFFLFFAFPLNAAQLFSYHTPLLPYFVYYGFIGATLNSAINPFIYYLVGRYKKIQSRKKIKKILEDLFQEEESCMEEVDSALETRL